MPKITLDNINVDFSLNKKAIHVLGGLSGVFQDSSVNVILGESGCGKTTLLRLLCGGISPVGGRIYFDDLDVTDLSIRDRNIALVNQNINLYPHLNVFKNLAFPLMHTLASGEEIKERVYEMAELLEISHLLTRKPKQISLGQAQRVAIGKALIKKPNVILFDEPFSNLDEPLRVKLRGDLKKILVHTKTTTVFVTHSVKEAMAIGDYVYIMGKGNIEEALEPSKLLSAQSEAGKQLIRSEFNENELLLG